MIVLDPVNESFHSGTNRIPYVVLMSMASKREQAAAVEKIEPDRK